MEFITKEDFEKKVKALLLRIYRTDDEVEKEKLNLEIKRLKRLRFESQNIEELENIRKRRM